MDNLKSLVYKVRNEDIRFYKLIFRSRESGEEKMFFYSNIDSPSVIKDVDKFESTRKFLEVVVESPTEERGLKEKGLEEKGLEERDSGIRKTLLFENVRKVKISNLNILIIDRYDRLWILNKFTHRALNKHQACSLRRFVERPLLVSSGISDITQLFYPGLRKSFFVVSGGSSLWVLYVHKRRTWDKNVFRRFVVRSFDDRIERLILFGESNPLSFFLNKTTLPSTMSPFPPGLIRSSMNILNDKFLPPFDNPLKSTKLFSSRCLLVISIFDGVQSELYFSYYSLGDIQARKGSIVKGYVIKAVFLSRYLLVHHSGCDGINIERINYPKQGESFSHVLRLEGNSERTISFPLK